MAETFTGINTIAFMAALLVLGVALRARFKILQKALLPASLIGGAIGFVLITSNLSFGYVSGDYVAPAFHFFTLSFLALLLTGGEGDRSESAARGGWWMTVGWLTIFVTQGLIGLGVISIYKGFSSEALSDFLGLLAPLGFAQGPGQAVATGAQWESEFNIQLAVNFGLIFASVGFVASFLVGVPAARWAIRSGLNSNLKARLDDVYLAGVYPAGKRPSMGEQVTHSANIESLAYHVGLLGVAYLLTDQYLRVMQPLVSGLTPWGIPIGLIFTHNYFFLHGMLICLAIRSLLDRFGYGHVIDRDTMKRITGTAVDLMLISSMLSVQFDLLSQYFVPIMLVSLGGITASATLCVVFGRMMSRLQPERAIALFGVTTGTTGSGFLLLRMLDPDLSTPVARELAFFAIALTFAGTHLLYVMVPVLPSFSLATIAVVYVAHMVVGALLWMWLARRA